MYTSNASRAARWQGIVAVILFMAASAGAGDHDKQKHHVRKLDQGVYYPNMYYSRAYIQQFPLQPGDRPLFFRLSPFQHYGRYEQGCPIEPDLTDGTFQLTHFQYRYRWDFEPPEEPKPIQQSPCDDPRARRWENLVAPESGVGKKRDPRDKLTAH